MDQRQRHDTAIATEMTIAGIEGNEQEEETTKPEPMATRLTSGSAAHPVSRSTSRLEPYSVNQQKLKDAADEQLNVSGLKRLKSTPGSYSVSHDAMMRLAVLFKEVHYKMMERTQAINKLEIRLLMAEDGADCLRLFYGASEYIWKITKFSGKFKDAENGVTHVLYSPAFVAHGYKIRLGLCPHGDGKDAQGMYMSVFFAILRGQNDETLDWPFDYSVTFSLLGQSDSKQVDDLAATFVPNLVHRDAAILDRPTTSRKRMLGMRQFVAHTDLWKGDFVKDDTIFIRLQVHQKSQPILQE